MKYTIKIGRDKSNDIEINEPRISRFHAIITDIGSGAYEIKDLGSTNGTYVNGEKITQRRITSVDKVEVASCLVNWHPAFSEPDLTRVPTKIEEEPFARIRKTISLGSANDNDMVIAESIISKHHAKISVLKNGNYYIEDLNSSNGTFVNGFRIQSKNFTKTDVVKLALLNLPKNWFQHEGIRLNLFQDRKMIWLISLGIVIAAVAILVFLRFA